ncbi:MAG: DUF4924 family protein [Parvicellaceae bacterium]
MLLANQIKENNIAEYILYMWKAEDLVRGFNLDINLIKESFIEPNSTSTQDQKEMLDWYNQLIKSLKIQGKTKKGHSNDVNEILIELNYLHNTLINLMQDSNYSSIYKNALPFIEEFRKLSDNQENSDIQMCFNGLYGKLILKLQKKPISDDTELAFSHFRNVLGHLSVKYKQMKAGKLNI